MKTTIKTIHEETSGEENKYNIGVLLNISEDGDWHEALMFYYNPGIKVYVFFDTITELTSYVLYGEERIKRAYLEEFKFDEYYDSVINGSFRKKLDFGMNES